MDIKEATKLGKQYKQTCTHNVEMKINPLRLRIMELDVLIANVKSDEQKIKYIDESIELNCIYVYLLRRSIPFRIVLTVILSFAFLIGLFTILPGITFRNRKSEICVRRINKLNTQKSLLIE